MALRTVYTKMDELGKAIINLWVKPEKEANEKVAHELKEVGVSFGEIVIGNVYSRAGV